MVAHSTLTGASLHETKGVAAASDGQILIADGAGSAAWAGRQVNFIGVICSDSTTQTAPGVGLKKAITLDTNLIQEGVTHTGGSSDFTIVTPGFYNLITIPQVVTGGGGAGQVEVSWEINTGGGFATIVGSPVIIAFAASDEGIPVCDIWVTAGVGDIVRAMWATDSTNVNIQPVTSLVGDTIPSVQQYVTLHGN